MKRKYQPETYQSIQQKIRPAFDFHTKNILGIILHHSENKTEALNTALECMNIAQDRDPTSVSSRIRSIIDTTPLGPKLAAAQYFTDQETHEAHQRAPEYTLLRPLGDLNELSQHIEAVSKLLKGDEHTLQTLSIQFDEKAPAQTASNELTQQFVTQINAINQTTQNFEQFKNQIMNFANIDMDHPHSMGGILGGVIGAGSYTGGGGVTNPNKIKKSKPSDEEIQR